MKIFGDLSDSSSLGYCLIFVEAGGRALSLRAPMSENLIRQLKESALCFAGRARFALTG